MQNWLHSFVLTFVPLFIVIDALGTLPLVLSFSEGMSSPEQRRMIHLAILTAALVGLAFVFFGQFILNVMNISVGAFAVAGGVILLVLSIKYMATGQMFEATRDEMVAVVPIGTPLIVGPATITTLLLLMPQFSLSIILLSFALNLLLAWFIFMLGEQIVRFIGRGGLKAVSRVFNLLIAAIAINMIIRGLTLIGILNVPTQNLAISTLVTIVGALYASSPSSLRS